jgi:hypothetical protein
MSPVLVYLVHLTIACLLQLGSGELTYNHETRFVQYFDEQSSHSYCMESPASVSAQRGSCLVFIKLWCHLQFTVVQTFSERVTWLKPPSHNQNWKGTPNHNSKQHCSSSMIGLTNWSAVFPSFKGLWSTVLQIADTSSSTIFGWYLCYLTVTKLSCYLNNIKITQ